MSVAMAIPIQLSNFSSSSALPKPNPNYERTGLPFPLKLTAKRPSLKELCKEGKLKEAFQAFTHLFSCQNPIGFIPDEAYSSVIELCASRKALSEGKQIHAHLVTSNCLCDSAFLNTKLVFMYGKCGSVWDAEKLFEEMPERNVFSWNAMIGGYVSNGRAVEALELYRDMRLAGVDLDAFTFPCILKACGAIKDVKQGAEIHGYAIKAGCDSNGFVVNAIVSLYAKCNDIFSARMMFDRMGERDDVVLWNSIISAYSSTGECVEALNLFREMQRRGVSTNTYSLVAVLQACEEESFRKLGMEIHGHILKSNNHLDLFVANALLVMYARCGQMTAAANIFYGMRERDNISWNSMLSGFLQNGLYREALQFFDEMLVAGLKPDQVSIINILSASGQLGYLFNGMEAHAYAVKHSLDDGLLVGNTLTDMYAKCSRLDYMERVFTKMPEKDLISWTTVISGYALGNYYTRALEVFLEAQAEEMVIDALMIGSVLIASTGLKLINYIKEIHAYTMKRGLCDLMACNTLVDAYGECGFIDIASRVFESVQNKDVVSWTSMISAYVDNGLGNEAFRLFGLMKQSGTEPDYVALLSLLSAAASVSALKKGKEIHGILLRKAFLVEGLIVNALLDMYARCGSIENSLKVFNLSKYKDKVLWTAMINASGLNGQGRMAIDLFNKMEQEKVYPDHITFLALLYACSHSGLTDEGQQFLETMKQKYLLEPWPEHYACVVDLLGRANRLEDAYNFIKKMPVKPTAVVWSSLLGSCHVHNNEKLSEIAANELLALEPENPGNYVLISNVYASTGKWDDVERVRMRMRKVGLKKNPACSWIEIKNKVHTFMARDRSHPETDEIYRKLAQVTEVLEKEGGYVAQTKFVLHNVREEEKVQMLREHSERLAIAYGLLNTSNGTPLRVTKNLRICGDCHGFIKLVSKFEKREIVARDASRFHHFADGRCSCGDFW